MRQPRVSFVLATHNRRAVVAETLARVALCGLDRRDFEVVVVDNDSHDGTPDAIEDRCDVLIRLDRNAGSCAKALGVDRASGRYIVFLDDDSRPRAGSVARMIEHFEVDATLGAAGFVVHLPDGRLEGGALPDVFVGCGVGFRAEALRAVGGLDISFFMQAEEYDLSFRLAGAGWRVRMFDDLHVEHEKTSDARQSDRTTYYDIRNNLRVAARYLPRPYHDAYRADWLQRYAWLALRNETGRAFRRGVRSGRLRASVERRTYRRYRLPSDALEYFFRWAFTEQRMQQLAARGGYRIVLADIGKNVFAFHRAARRVGLHVAAIGDDRFAAPGRRYRGVPIVPLDEALALGADAVVVANCSAVHGTNTYRRALKRLVHLGTPDGRTPVHHWFGPADEVWTAASIASVHAARTDSSSDQPAEVLAY